MRLPWRTDRRRAAEPDAAQDRTIGCFLGGAIGDALGAGIEFWSLGRLREEFGPAGVTGFVEAYGRRGAITDDTQMTLFTADGLVKASIKRRSREAVDLPTTIFWSYQQWLATQERRGERSGTGWLAGVPGLWSSRAPGITCLSALRSGVVGTVDEPINDSKGCGGVMRVAPVGVCYPDAADRSRRRFLLGAQAAAVTHGHVDGYLSSGYLSCLAGELIDGMSLDEAFDAADNVLATWHDAETTFAAVRRARKLGERGLPRPEAIETLGGGWVGEEALAIAVACVVGALQDAAGDPARAFRPALLAAVNHSGDSDSTGALAGAILGALGGVAVLPTDWLAELELRDVIERMAEDTYLELRGAAPTDAAGRPDPAWFARYQATFTPGS